ncbi:hypothetical protein ACQ4M3_28940 [Leptolyngbya sp. AN03gr2]|uniref:hypothetical protein n=1 Tax=unclassified Leptolyngbya TaxID=2650499 RepID=UPI003D3178F4
MRNTLTQAIKIVFSPETILPFLVGSLSLSIFGNAIYDICKNEFGTTTPELARISAIAFLILVAAVLVVGWGIRRVSRLAIDIPFEVRQRQLDRKYPGLILLVSNPEACETAIRFHLPTLKCCWLICSSKTLEQAQKLRQQFYEICPDEPIVINDIYNPLIFRDCIDGIYRDRLPKGWQESDVIADYTGMTAHASVGTVLACITTVRPLQYTPAKADPSGKIVGSLNPIKVILGSPSIAPIKPAKRIVNQG